MAAWCTTIVSESNLETPDIMNRKLPLVTVGSVLWLAAVAVLFLGPKIAWAQEARLGLEQQLQEQKAKNDALRARIAELEKLLATDVCNNPEAAAAIRESAAPDAKTIEKE
jgi:hypothetical protein